MQDWRERSTPAGGETNDATEQPSRGGSGPRNRNTPYLPLWALDLTPRELEVLQMIALGLSDKEIARRLTISRHTVKVHVGRVLHKLGASGRTEAAVKWTRRYEDEDLPSPSGDDEAGSGQSEGAG